MSVNQEQVPVASSFESFGNLILGIVADVKAGKAPGAVVADATAPLVSALEQLSQLASDAQNKQAVDDAVALFGVKLKETLFPVAL